MAKREIGSLWIGGNLTWLEYVCLKSFADRGHDITLFTYADVGPIPEGVRQRSGREIIDTDSFLKYNRKDSFALFADLFRMHMVHKNPGMIWVDTDTYCLRPVELEDEYVFGPGEPTGNLLANGVFSAPPDSELLRSILDFMEDLHPVPPFFPERRQNRYRRAKEAGTPVHVSDMPWGTWGPDCLTWFAMETGTHGLAQPFEAFHPVPYPRRRAFLKPAERVEPYLTERSSAINVFGSNKVRCLKQFDGLPPEGSYLDKMLKDHGVDPGQHPIIRPGRKSAKS